MADGAFAGIEDGTVIRVPQKMLARYQKLFVKKGLSLPVFYINRIVDFTCRGYSDTGVLTETED